MPGKGIMIAMNHRLVNTVINRCTMPADGDILVPIRTVSVIGTTDIHVEDPDHWEITREEVQAMLEAGENLVPGFRQARALRAWGGVRPLYQDTAPADDRDITRAHTVIDHSAADGVGKLVTIVGGKFATYRLMAEETVDEVCRQLERRSAVPDGRRAAPRLRAGGVLLDRQPAPGAGADAARRSAHLRVRARASPRRIEEEVRPPGTR